MKIKQIIKADVLNILRDRSLIMILLVPVLITMLLRIVPPLYEAHFPEAIQYRPFILAMFSLVTNALAGFLIAFSMLDEKDIQLFQVFRIMPLPFKKLVSIRLVLIALIGFIFNLILITASNFINLSVIQILLLSLLCSTTGPLSTLTVVGIAQNKIEGVTYFKLFNLLLALPIAGIFIDAPFKYLFGIIPFYWVYEAFQNTTITGAFYLYVAIGFAISLAYLKITHSFFLRNT